MPVVDRTARDPETKRPGVQLDRRRQVLEAECGRLAHDSQAACGAAPLAESAPGPVVAHSFTSNQCVPSSAATTSGCVWAALTTWWSASQQISTSSSDSPPGSFPTISNGQLGLAHGHVLELEIGRQLHQRRPVGAGPVAHRAASFAPAPPGSFEADEPAALVVGVDEHRDAARKPVEQAAVVPDEREVTSNRPNWSGGAGDVETQREAVAAPVPAERRRVDDLLGDEQARSVAHLEVRATVARPRPRA